MTESQKHWQTVYQTKKTNEVSWYQDRPATSLNLIERSGGSLDAAIIDVGGGASTFVDCLIEKGFRNVSVLDISSEAIRAAKVRLGKSADQVKWIEGDITKVELPHGVYDLWHDRALFHFLTDVGDREKYLRKLRQSLRSNGHVIISTFSLDGPKRCSGLDIRQYDAQSLGAELGEDFDLIETLNEQHPTPFGTTQKFIYCHFRKR
mgnify:CR=1 FL=1